MRVLFTTNPALGHLHPLLPLLRAAQRAGHDVVVATGPDLAAQLPGRGIAGWAAGPTLPELLGGLAGPPVGPPEPAGGPPLRDAQVLFGGPARVRAEQLLARARAWRPDLVVSELAELSGPVLADDLGVPLVVHGFGPLQPGVDVLAEVLVGRLGDELGRPGLLERLRAATYLDVCPPSMRPDVAYPWREVRPLRPSAGEVAAGDRLPDALDRLPHRDRVYVTLGTVFNDPRVLGRVVDGLQALPVDLVVTTGSPAGVAALGARPPHVLVRDYLPQALLLPRCTAVVSHAGAGTLLGALVHGLPQVLLPQGAEQASNAEAAERRGVGTTRADLAALPEALRSVLDGPGSRAAAREVALEIAGMPSADDVLRGLLPAPAAAVR